MTSLFGVKREKIESASLWMAGIVLLGLAASMVPCIIFAAISHEPVSTFLIPFIIYLVLGSAFLSMFRMGYVRPANVMVMLAVIWLVSMSFGMLPFMLEGMAWYDALMESASGITAAGCSTISDYSQWSDSILFYRSFSNWVGGIMIILIVMIILPMAGVGNRSVVANEMAGSESTTVSVRIRDAAIQFAFIYVLLTAIMFVLLVITGTSAFDAISISLCTISTGGLISGDMDISFSAQVLMIIFMFLGGTNFYLHFKAIFLRKPNVYAHNSEFCWLVVWCILMSLVMFAIVLPYSTANTAETYFDSLFAVISASTTAGYTLPAMESWPEVSLMLMFAIAFVGASSGSTSGGIKVTRMVILFKYAKNSIERIIHPNNVQEVYVDGSPVSQESVRTAAVIVAMFMASILLFTMIFILCGEDSSTSIKVVLAMITQFGTVNVPIEMMSPFLKVMMVIMMWAGRLEIFIALVILSPRVWKEHFKDVKYKMRKNPQ